MSMNMFGTSDVLAKALEGTWQRNNAISSNIANVDTPGYKRQDVVFESYLAEALQRNDRPTSEDLASVVPKRITDRSSTSYRLDGNNVDLDTEMTYLAENQLKYNALVSQVNYNFSRIKSVLNG